MFFTLEKLVLKAGSTPPRYLLDTSLSVEILQLFLIAFPTAPRYLVNRSRKLLPPRQLLDTWWIDRASVLRSIELFLDTSAVNNHFLGTYLDSFLNTYIYQALLRVYIFILRDPILISSISLDLSAPVHLPNTISLTPNLFLVIFQNFLRFFFYW